MPAPPAPTRSNWRRTTLGDIGRVVTGQTPPRARPEYWGQSIPFLTPTDMDGRRFVGHTLRALSPAGAHALQRLVIPAGVAVSCIGWQMGKSIIIDTPTVTNQQLNTVIITDKNVDRLYLYYTLKSQREQFFLLGQGGSRTPIVKKSLFEKTKLALPPLAMQRHIATILGALDNKIELNRAMNQTLDEIVQALFQSWFIDFDGTQGQIPRGWRRASLDQIADFTNGAAFQRFPAVSSEHSLPVIKIRELRDGVTARTQRASSSIPAKYIIDDGDLLFSWSGSLLVTFWSGGRGALNQHLFKVTSDAYPTWLCYLWCRHHLDRFRAIAADRATTMGHIKRSHLAEALVWVPPASQLQAMTEAISPLLCRQQANRLESRSLAGLRDTLLPGLVTGQLRIPEAERAVGEFLSR